MEERGCGMGPVITAGGKILLPYVKRSSGGKQESWAICCERRPSWRKEKWQPDYTYE